MGGPPGGGGIVTALRSVNPHRPSEVVVEFEETDPAAVQQAVAGARDALGGWRTLPAAERGRALSRIADELEEGLEELAGSIVREVGKPITEARSEVARAAGIFRYYAQVVLLPDGESYPASEAGAWLLSRRYPVGVCALITPWNFPVAIPAWKAAPALGYGNSVLFKPAPAATATGRALGETIGRHLPQGVFRVLPGAVQTGRALASTPEVDAVSFTGSRSVGREVASSAALGGVRSQSEMGGQNASIVLDDADLDQTAEVIAAATMGYAGQKCTATSRILVQASIFDRFVERLVGSVEQLQVEDPQDESCRVGPVIGAEARERALSAVASSAGRVLTGGMPIEAEGFYMAPTLVELEDTGNPLGREEVFAPVAGVIRIRDDDEAIRIANEVPYGLVGAVFTKNLQRAMDATDRLETGLVRVNAPTSGVDFHAPFGGARGSGLGSKEQGLAARDFYTEDRTILVRP